MTAAGRGRARLWLVVPAAAFVLVRPSAAEGRVANGSVVELRCESQRNPLGIDERRPRLGWAFESGERDQAQFAYQVVVASTRAALDRGQADLWDSGRTAGQQSAEVVYDGRPLASRRTYHWKVRVWDRQGRVSPWSAPAHWETAFLDPAEWTARWLNDGKPLPASDEAFYDDDPAPLFRREFELAAAALRARLYISGLGYYEASLNGERVGDRVLDPGWTSYGKRVYYSTYDVSRQLRRGRNCLGVTLGNGWYNPLPLRMWGRLNLREHLVVGRPRFIAQLEVALADGSRRVIASDDSWRVAAGPLRRNSVYLGERYDARHEVPGWDRPGQDDRSWRRASLAAEPVGPLQAQPQPPIRIADTLEAVAITEPLPGVFVFDLGQNFAGWARLRLTAPSGTEVRLRYAELLNPDGTLNPLTSVAGQIKGLRRTTQGTLERIGGPGAPELAVQTDSYVARGGAEESFTPRFGFRGFRYVEVTGYPGRPAAGAVTGLRLHPDLEEAGSFESSSDLVNRIHAMSRRTFLSNLFSVQSDCPHREKFAYGGDIVATSDALMLGFDMARFYEKAVTDWADSARDDGMLTDTAPFVGIQYCGVGWAMVHPVLQWQLHQYYGNRRLIERQYDTSRRWLELVAAGAPDHVIREGLGDHEALAETQPEALLTPLYHESARLLAVLARRIGRETDAARHTALAEAIRGAYARSPAGQGPPATQSAAAFALQLGLLSEPDRAAAVAWLVDDIRARGGHLSTGIFGTKFALEALSRAGQAQAVFDLVSAQAPPGWGHMLATGATTLWEHWAGSDDTYSHNHPMFGSVDEWLMRWLGGIQPDPAAVGFDRIVLRPQPVDGLDWVRSSYRSLRGPIVSSWSRRAGVFSWDVTIPANTSATAFVPARSLDEVTEGRETPVPALRATGVRAARMDGAAAILQLGSGSYHFVSQPRTPHPNILVVVTDDQRWNALGAASNPVILTPTLDRLAREGVRFENAFATTPICAASRASILTGLYERTHGYTFTKPPLARALTLASYPALLRRAGYRTGFVGKLGVAVEKGAEAEMFDVFRPSALPYFQAVSGEKRYLSDLEAERAVEFLREARAGRPFCLSVSFWAPHAEDDAQEQYFWPADLDGLYADVTLQPPPTSEPAFFESLPEFLRRTLNRERWYWRFDTPGKYQQMVKGYYRTITAADRALGRILDELRRQGVERNTVIVFTSDNGAFLGDRGYADKWTMHEASIRVPLLVLDPRLPAAARGRILTQMVLNVDILPTVLELAGLAAPPGLPGASLVPLVAGRSVAGRAEVFTEHLWDHPKIPRTEAVRTERFKYIRYPQHPEFEELYDLANDSWETRNLAREEGQQQRLAELRRHADEWIQRLSALGKGAER
jgi:alpha-L-rhamnosidase